MADGDEITLQKENRAGLITLNRPKALNAFTLDMIRKREEALKTWISDPHIYGVVQNSAVDNVFSVGGDLRAIYEWKQRDAPELIGVFREEYQQNWHLEIFKKPTVSLVDGLVMGGGVGMTIYGTHFVAGENTRFAMPETGIGFFPDVGASYFLSQLPGKLGLYMGLTGYVADAADLYFLDIATHVIANKHYDAIREAMIEADPVDDVLEELHDDPGPAALAQRQQVIDRIFSRNSVENILDALDRETGEHAEWAQETAETLRQKAPISLKVTFRLLQDRASNTSLKAALQTDFRLASRFIQDDNFFEGIRALLIDKDKAPKWQPARLEDITDDMVDRYFEGLGDEELELTDLS